MFSDINEVLSDSFSGSEGIASLSAIQDQMYHRKHFKSMKYFYLDTTTRNVNHW